VFRASKPWREVVASGVVLHEQWLNVEGTPLALVHVVHTTEDGFKGELFAVDAATGVVWPGAISTEGCPALETVRAMSVLYRRGGVVLVRLSQSDAPKKPFASCVELKRESLKACTLRVPVRVDTEEIASGPDQAKLGSGWIAASAGRIDWPKAPNSGLRLTTALRECIGDDDPVLAPMDDRLAIAGANNVLLVSEGLSAACTPCAGDDGTWSLPGPPDSEALKKRSAAAALAWRAGRRDEALQVWRELYRGYWAGPRESGAAWSEMLEAFGVALAGLKEPAQARQVLGEAWLTAKAPSASLMTSMGDVFRELGDADAAIAAYQRVLAADATRAQREHAIAELAKLRR
jgi:hypothetical protein